MTGRELWGQYEKYTRDITEHGRKLGFAGAAICWLFRTEHFVFPVLIYISLLFFVAYFAADILQGLWASLKLHSFIEGEETRLQRETGSIEGEVNKPRWLDRPVRRIFIAKCVLLILGFLFIGWQLLAILI